MTTVDARRDKQLFLIVDYALRRCADMMIFKYIFLILVTSVATNCITSYFPTSDDTSIKYHQPSIDNTLREDNNNSLLTYVTKFAEINVE